MNLKSRPKHPLRRLGAAVFGVALLLVYGTLGYVLIEHYSVLDGLFMTVITVTTVGYEEVHKLDAAGEIFTISVIIFGVGGFLYTFSVLVEAISSGNYREYRRLRKLEATIRELSDHVIVCGYGRTGTQVVKELQALRQPYVVVEINDAPLADAVRANEPHIVGDATSGEVLEAAGIDRARALVCAVDSDERAVYIVLTARSLNSDIYIVARSGHTGAHSKMRRAGADRVVNPYLLSGERLAALAMQPAVVDALDMVRSGVAATMRIEEMMVSPGVVATDAAALRRSGSTLLALGHDDGSMVVGPIDTETVMANDIVVAMGTREQLNTLATMLRPAVPVR